MNKLDEAIHALTYHGAKTLSSEQTNVLLEAARAYREMQSLDIEKLHDIACKVGSAGNNLGLNLPQPHPYHTSSYEHALEKLGAEDVYNGWCAWKLCYEAYNGLCEIIEKLPQPPQQGEK